MCFGVNEVSSEMSPFSAWFAIYSACRHIQPILSLFIKCKLYEWKACSQDEPRCCPVEECNIHILQILIWMSHVFNGLKWDIFGVCTCTLHAVDSLKCCSYRNSIEKYFIHFSMTLYGCNALFVWTISTCCNRIDTLLRLCTLPIWFNKLSWLFQLYNCHFLFICMNWNFYYVQ